MTFETLWVICNHFGAFLAILINYSLTLQIKMYNNKHQHDNGYTQNGKTSGTSVIETWHDSHGCSVAFMNMSLGTKLRNMEWNDNGAATVLVMHGSIAVLNRVHSVLPPSLCTLTDSVVDFHYWADHPYILLFLCNRFSFTCLYPFAWLTLLHL